MGALKIRLTALSLIFILSACDKMELRGFLISYEHVNDRFDQSMEWNRNNPISEIDVAQNTYTVYAMGDSHVGGTKNLDNFFNNAINENSAAVVMVGDLTSGHKADYETFSFHLPAPGSLQYFPVAGNHDLYFNGWKHYYSIFGSSTYYFVVNTPEESDLFICLDSGGGTLGSKQLEWIKTLLKTKRNNYRYCTVFTHNNIFRLRPTATTNPFVEEIHALTDMFLRYNVNMVVTAHDHKRNTQLWGNTIHIIMDALLDGNKDASYLKIIPDAENINYSFVEL